MLRVLRRRKREHGEAGDLSPSLLGRVTGPEIGHGSGNRGEVTFDERFVEMHSGVLTSTPDYLCFFAGTLTGTFAGVFAAPAVFVTWGFVSTPPSSSERPSSTS